KRILTMSTVFQITQRPVIFLCKCLGIINISTTSGPDGLLTQNTNITFYSFLELTRIIAIFIITYNVQKHVLLPEKVEIYKCWVIIISAKISEKWIIKLINGIMEYDKKLTSTLTLNVIQGRPIIKKNWKLIFSCVFAYYVGTSVLTLMVLPKFRVMQLKIVPFYFIVFLSNAIDVTLVISTYFYLQNLEYRFHTLNGFWTQFQNGLTTTPIVETSWTHDEITMFVDNIRRLHAELCELLKIFSTGFGQMLVAFFLFIYISIV
ncbi:Gustatory receptor, partial [Aphis craccivora]